MPFDLNPARPLPGDVWTVRYEDLRREVVDEHRGFDRGPGLALMVHRGLVAWMQAWPKEVSPHSCAGFSDSAESTPVEPIRFSTDLRHEMALVLVGMLLGHKQATT